MSATIPKAGTSQKEGPEGRSKGPVEPHQGKATKSGPLYIVQVDHVNRSPSWTQNQCLKKTKQLGNPLQTSIWGPH